MRLILDYAKKTKEVNAHATLDLEACYDLQIPDLCVTVEEIIRASRKVVKLITKVMSRLEHHVGTANGASKEKCGGTNKTLGRLVKGSMFSGAACEDVSCLIFRRLEKKKLGMFIR